MLGGLLAGYKGWLIGSIPRERLTNGCTKAVGNDLQLLIPGKSLFSLCNIQHRSCWFFMEERLDAMAWSMDMT